VHPPTSGLFLQPACWQLVESPPSMGRPLKRESRAAAVVWVMQKVVPVMGTLRQCCHRHPPSRCAAMKKLIQGLARRDRKGSLNDGQIQNASNPFGIVPLFNFVPRGFRFVHHSIAILYHEVPNPSLTIRDFCIAVGASDSLPANQCPRTCSTAATAWIHAALRGTAWSSKGDTEAARAGGLCAAGQVSPLPICRYRFEFQSNLVWDQ
jgi:hypothetical protein